MNEENKDKEKPIEVEEFQEFARKRPPDPPEEGSNWLRGCGINNQGWRVFLICLTDHPNIESI